MALNIGVDKAQSTVGVIVTAVLIVVVAGALVTLFFTNLATIVGVFNNSTTTTGDSNADALLPVVALITAFLGLFAFGAIIWRAIQMRA